MAYWLVKSEPSTYSWDQFVKDKKTIWDGVRNYGSRNNLEVMKLNDKVLFYHSNVGVEIVGIAKVTKESFQDPTTENPAWLSVELVPVKKLKKTVPLKIIKEDKQLSEMALVRLGRLSVQPVSKTEWEIIMNYAGEKV